MSDETNDNIEGAHGPQLSRRFINILVSSSAIKLPIPAAVAQAAAATTPVMPAISSTLAAFLDQQIKVDGILGGPLAKTGSGHQENHRQPKMMRFGKATHGITQMPCAKLLKTSC